MNPYETPPPDGREAEATEIPVVDPDELRKKQIRLVIRLALLAAATTVVTLAAIFFVGFQMMPVAMVVALILGIVFTIVLK